MYRDVLPKTGDPYPGKPAQPGSKSDMSDMSDISASFGHNRQVAFVRFVIMRHYAYAAIYHNRRPAYTLSPGHHTPYCRLEI